MATFELTGPDGGTYQLEAPSEQAALAAFSQFTGASKPDPAQTAAAEDIQKMKDAGIPLEAGLTRRLVHGATLGADNTVMAAALAPIEAYKRGVGLGEGYDIARAREDQLLSEARNKTGAAGTAAELLGGGVAGGGLANAGLTTTRLLSSAPGLLGRTATSAADAAALGGISGFNEGNGLSDRFSKAGEGALTGALIGSALPVGLAAAKGVVSPFLSNIIAQVDPHGMARRQVARAIAESGQAPDEIATALQQAHAEGQGGYALMDALGNPGQRMASTIARAPGEGRTNLVNYLEGRQANQGRRVANAISEGFGSRMTPDELRTAMTAERGAIADEAYGAVRNDAQPVDVQGVIDHIDANVPEAPAAPDTISGRLQRYRRMLTNGDEENPVNLSDFEQVQRVRSELSDEVQSARQSGQGNRARMLGQVLTRLDGALENASSGFRQANADFARQTRNIEAIDAGRAAATRGRTEDTIATYGALPPRGQQAFRTGYSDPLIAEAQAAPFGQNKARTLTSDAFRDESAAMAPGNDLLQRRLARENTMFSTRSHATGGSRTMDNINDHEALGIDPSIVGHVVAGNYGAAVRHLISAGSNKLTGNTPAVRSAVADILLRNGANTTPAQLQQLVGETVRRIQFVQELARGTKAAGLGALAVAPNTKRKSSSSIFFKRAS